MRSERGFTLIELLIAATLMLVVMGAAFTALERFQMNSRANNELNDQLGVVRVAMDRAARELRNGASPAVGRSSGVDAATPTNLVLQIVDPKAPTGATSNVRNTRRVRYCLDDSVPANERLIRQVSATWTQATAPNAPSTASCPDNAWPTTEVLATHVTNNVTTARPVFCPTPGNPCPGSSIAAPNSVGSISRLQMNLFVDNDPAKQPSEVHLQTGLYFRAQVQAPTAAFGYSISGGDIFLNASDSATQDGSQLTYKWTDNGADAGSGMTNAITSPSSGSHTIVLTVSDPSGLSTSVSKVVDVQ